MKRLKTRTPDEGERDRLIALIRYAIDVHPFKRDRLFKVRPGSRACNILLTDDRARDLAGNLRPFEMRTLMITATKGQGDVGYWTLWGAHAWYNRDIGQEIVEHIYAVESYVGDVARKAALWPEMFMIEDALDTRMQDDFEKTMNQDRRKGR